MYQIQKLNYKAFVKTAFCPPKKYLANSNIQINHSNITKKIQF